MRFFTIGYEGINVTDLFNVLSEHEISLLVDVRENPFSRKPGFSKGALSNFTHLYGKNYLHLGSLGCPKVIRQDYALDRNWAKYSQRYFTQLETQLCDLNRLINIMARETCCLLCFEADYRLCHRSLIAQRIIEESRDVIYNITHLNSRAIRNTVLQYPSEDISVQQLTID